MLPDAFTDAVETDRRNVVLCTRIVAAADLYADVLQIFRDTAGRKHFRERPGESLGRRDAKAAGICPRAGNNVLDQFSTRIG